MAIRTNLNYRFMRSADQEERMKYLVHDLKLFRSYSQILMVSAVIGYNNDAFCPVTASASDTVQMTTFQEKDRDVIDFIAFAYKKEQSVLNSDEKYSIFEAFANGGFPILFDKLGIDFQNKEKNNRVALMKKYLSLLLANKF